MRYRLIPTRGIGGSRFFEGAEGEALTEAREGFERTGVPVLVVLHPPGGRGMRRIGTVPDAKEIRALERARKKTA